MLIQTYVDIFLYIKVYSPFTCINLRLRYVTKSNFYSKNGMKQNRKFLIKHPGNTAPVTGFNSFNTLLNCLATADCVLFK